MFDKTSSHVSLIIMHNAFILDSCSLGFRFYSHVFYFIKGIQLPLNFINRFCLLFAIQGNVSKFLTMVITHTLQMHAS